MSDKEHIYSLIKKYEESLSQEGLPYFDADQFCEIAEYYDEIGDIDSMNDVLEKGLEIHPENEELQIRKGKVLLAQDNYSEALKIAESYHEAYELEWYFFKLECYIANNRIGEATKYVKFILDKEKGERNEILADLAILFVNYNYYSRAIDLLAKIDKYDDDIEILFEIGYCYEMLNEPQNSIEIYNKILDIDPYNDVAWINIGRMYALQEEYKKALEAFDYSLMLNPETSLNVLRLKANCLILYDKAYEAIPILSEIYERNLEDAEVLLSLAETYSTCDLFSKSFECLSEYKEKKGENLEYIKKKINIYLLMDDIKRAKETLYDGINKLGFGAELRMYDADIDIICGSYEEALIKYSSIYDDLPEVDIELVNKLSTTCIHLEKFEDSLFYVEMLLEEEPENQEFIRRLALLYLELNDKENYNKILREMTDENLFHLVCLAYEPIDGNFLERELMLSILENVFEARILYKNLKY